MYSKIDVIEQEKTDHLISYDSSRVRCQLFGSHLFIPLLDSGPNLKLLEESICGGRPAKLKQSEGQVQPNCEHYMAQMVACSIKMPLQKRPRQGQRIGFLHFQHHVKSTNEVKISEAFLRDMSNVDRFHRQLKIWLGTRSVGQAQGEERQQNADVVSLLLLLYLLYAETIIGPAERRRMRFQLEELPLFYYVAMDGLEDVVLQWGVRRLWSLVARVGGQCRPPCAMISNKK